MLIASVISVSASSPASGEFPVDFSYHPQTHQAAAFPIEIHPKQKDANLFKNFKHTKKQL
jgi:hypothetical protein